MHQSSNISQGFWADRLNAHASPASSSGTIKSVSAAEVPATKTIEESYVQADLPFESDAALLEKYIGAFTTVRIGRLMEGAAGLCLLPVGALSDARYRF